MWVTFKCDPLTSGNWLIMENTKTITTHSPEETIAMGARVAANLREGDFIALIGELGTGKTMFVKGLARGLGMGDYIYVNSPSFVIVKEYEGRLPLYHMDLYRLNDISQIETIGYEDYLNSDGVCVIEWAEKIKNLLPKKYIKVEIRLKGKNKRLIKL